LQKEGLIKVENGFVSFPDKDRAIAYADFDERFLEQFQTHGLVTKSVMRPPAVQPNGTNGSPDISDRQG
jgi:hypothetical protein